MARKRKRSQKVEYRREFKDSNLIILIVILGLIYFYKILSPNVMLFATDQITAGFPFRAFHAYVLKTFHHIPFWDPYLFSGIPFIDAFHGDIFYPFSFLRIIFPPHIVLNWFFIVHAILAGIFMFLYLRLLKLNKFVSFLFAVSFMFTGTLISLTYPGHDGKMAVSAFIPVVFYFIHKGYLSEKFGYFALAGMFMGFGILSPHVQMMYYLYLASGIYILALFIAKYREKGALPAVKIGVFFVISVIFSLLIGAVQLLPGYEYVAKFSPRGAGNRGYQFSVSWSLPWEDYISAFFAKFSGFLDSYWGRNPFKLNTEYMGAFAAFLGFVGFFNKKRKFLVWVFGIIAVFFSLVALGGYTPVYKLFYYLLPGIKKFRAPSMSFIFVAFAFNVLGAFGVEYIRERANDPKLMKNLWISIAVIFGIALLAFVAKGLFIGIFKGLFVRSQNQLKILEQYYSNIPLAFLRFSIVAAIAVYLLGGKFRLDLPVAGILTLVIIADLWSIDWKFLKTLPGPDKYYAKDEVVKTLEKDKGIYRVFPIFYRIDSNYLMLHRIESIGGHHGNQFQRYQEFLGNPHHFMFRPADEPNLYRYPWFADMLNVKYVVSQPIPQDLSPYRKNVNLYQMLYPISQFVNDTSHFRVLNVVPGQNNVRYAIYENKKFIPRVFAVDSIEVMKKEDVLKRMERSDFDPRKIAVLEEKPEFRPDTGALNFSFKMLEYQPDYWKFDYTLSKNALLVYSTNNYPKLEVLIDGKPVKTYQTDYILMGFEGIKGHHTVEIKFRSKEYNILGLVSVLTILVSIVAPIVKI